MEKIVKWLESCGYSHREATREAHAMVERNRWEDWKSVQESFLFR